MSSRNEFMPPNDKELIEILDLVNESDFDELRLEMSGLKLIFSKRAIELHDQQVKPAPEEAQEPVSYERTVSTESLQDNEPEVVAAPESALQKAEAEEAAPIEEEGLISINSPLLGIFYRASKPGAPPFVEVGTYVTEDDTVCLVEVMKLFNTVKAGVKGRIAKICAENNQMVEYNQTLFLIEPEGSPEKSSNA